MVRSFSGRGHRDRDHLARNRNPRRPASRRMQSPGQSAVIHDRQMRQCHGDDAVPGVTDAGAMTAGPRDRGGRSGRSSYGKPNGRLPAVTCPSRCSRAGRPIPAMPYWKRHDFSDSSSVSCPDTCSIRAVGESPVATARAAAWTPSRSARAPAGGHVLAASPDGDLRDRDADDEQQEGGLDVGPPGDAELFVGPGEEEVKPHRRG